MPAAHVRTVELALQGGGAQGAFTWGVLERLLQESRLRIAGVSGTSAGAMNAVVLADGLARGGREGARDALRRFWSRVGNASPLGAMGGGLLGSLLGDWGFGASPARVYLDLASRLFSPYQFNPLDINPLRTIVAEEVDFERLRRFEGVRVFVAATRVRTGESRIFGNRELSVDAVMASACLPLLYRAVEIDGEAYWDGAYAGNPSILPLLTASPSNDMIIVQVNPSRRDALPTRPQEILDRIEEISSNSGLLRDLRALVLAKRLVGGNGGAPRNGDPFGRQVAAVRVHRIEASEDVVPLGSGSGLNSTWSYLTRLHRAGHDAADEWLQRNGAHLGRRSTLDFRELGADLLPRRNGRS